MQRLRLLTVTSLAVLSSCTPPDAALRVNVTVRAAGMARVRADCLRLTISDDTQELKSLTIKRPADDGAVFAVRRGSDLPGTVKVQATGYIGSNCGDDSTLKLNAQGESVTGVFPESGVVELDVFLDPPNSTLDSDRDGYVAAARGGLDCKDDDNSVFPGAGQVCMNTFDTDCDGQGGCDDSECGSAAVCADPPDRVVITTSIATMLRYECRGPFRVELKNSNGVRRAIRDTAVELAASLPGVTVHGTSSCTDAAVTSLPIPYGSSFFEVYLKTDGQAFGINTLTATAAQVPMPGSAMVEVHPQPIDHLDFTSPARTVSAGTCGSEAVTLEFRDAQNRRTDVDAPTTLTLSSAPGDLMNANIFFSNPACTTDGQMQQLMPGQGAVTVYLLARRAGTFTLTATPSAGTGSTQPLTVQPAVPAKLAFTNGPLVLNTTQMCSAGLFTVQLQDQFDNPVNAPADVTVRMSVSTLVGVSLFEPTSNCSLAAQTDFTITAGSNSVSFRARGMNAAEPVGEIRGNALTGGAIADAVQQLRISAGTASKFSMTGGAQNPLASVCSANPFSIDLLDSAGNPASSPTPVIFTLSTTPAADASFHFYSGMGCQTDLNNTLTVPAGQTSVTFYYRGNRAITSFEIRASSALTAPTLFLPNNAIRAGPPGKLQFTAPLSQFAQAGTCTPSPFLANVLDLFDNPTSFPAAQTVTVTSNPAGVTVGASACSTGNSVLLGAGVQQVAFNAQHTVTSPSTPYSLTASVNGFSTAAPVSFNVIPGPSTLIVDTPAGATSTLAAGGCQQITLSRRDAFNNNAPTSGATPINLAFPTSTVWVVYSSNNCTTGMGVLPAMNSTHTVTFSVSPRTSGAQQMTASIPSLSQTAVVNFQVSAGAATLVFENPSTGMSTATAAQTVGGCTPVTVARKDAFGNDVPMGVAGNLTFTLATGTTAHSGTPCTGANAISSVALTSTDARASFYVSATKSSLTGGPAMQTATATLLSQSANLTLTVSPGASILGLSVPASSAVTLTANQCQIITLERRDSFGNLVPVPAATNVTISPAGLTLFSATDCTGAPILAVPVTALASTRSFSVRTTLASAAVAYTISLDGQNVPLSITVNPGPTTKLLVEGLPSTIGARTCSTILNVRRQDFWSNNVTAEPGLTVNISSARFQFSSQSSCTSPAVGATVTIANGSSASAELLYAIGTQAGGATVTANATAPSGAVSGMASSTINAGPASKVVFLDAPGTVVSGACSAGVRVELRDQDDNSVVPGSPVNVTLASSPNSPTFFSAAGCTGALPLQLTTANPIRTFSFRPTTAPASEVVTASSGSLTAANQTWTINVGTPTKMVWKANAPTPAARFHCVSAGTIEIQDANSNVAPNPNAAPYVVTLAPGTPATSGVTFFSDAACTTAATTVSIAQGVSETVPLFMVATGASPINLTATSSPALTAPTTRVVNLTGTGSYAVTPVDPALEAGACIAVTVERRDESNAVFTAGTTTHTVTVATPAATTLHLLADCSDAAATLPLSRVIASGTSTTVVYARGRSAAPSGANPADNIFTAADAFGGSGITTLKVYPLVRRGSCNIANTSSTSRCAVSPPIPGNVITRSFLVFSSTGSQTTTSPTQLKPADQDVECHLETGSAVEVVCNREGNVQPVNINYQVVSFGRDAASGFGVTVQHEVFATTAATTSHAFTTAVDTTKSFILASNTMNGNDNDGDAFPVVRFASYGASVSSVEVVANTSNPTRSVSAQVVSLGLAGSAVDHRNNSNPTQLDGGFTLTTNTTPVGTTFALAMAQVTANSTDANYMCKRRFNLKVQGTNVFLHRGALTPPSANCTTDAVVLSNVQRVTIPSATVRVPASDAFFNSNNTANMNTGTFTAVAPHKSITFLMVQGPGGQTAGESDFAGTANDEDDTGPFHATLDFTGAADRVSVTRSIAGANNTSVFSPIVVQFDP